ncbi:MAG TPA: hypothetical protein VIS06_21105 [Mycobacteriales bacterium]
MTDLAPTPDEDLVERARALFPGSPRHGYQSGPMLSFKADIPSPDDVFLCAPDDEHPQAATGDFGVAWPCDQCGHTIPWSDVVSGASIRTADGRLCVVCTRGADRG